MDKRVNYVIVLDCESCPLDRTLEGVTPSNMFYYDLGWQVTDHKGRVYEKKSFINADIFLDEKDLMNSAYYADKIPNYWEDIKNGSRVLKSSSNIRKELFSDIEKYNVKEVYAHNMRFDYGTLNNTQRFLTKSKSRYFFPYGVEICDTLKMARQVIAPMPTYKQFCIDNDYMTKNNQPRLTAEIIYRFISGNEDFEESHTGLEDVEIETEIMAYCYRKHQKMERKLWA